MKHIVQFSGGIGSWATALVVKEQIMRPDDELVLLFADVLGEDEDTYRFIEAACEDLGTPLTRITEGKTIWDVFEEQRFLGNSRIDPCSKFLKRGPLRRWIEANADPEDTVIYLGIDWSEEHRLVRARPRWEPWNVQAPLIDLRVDKPTLHRWAAEHGLPEQRLYKMGMPHANCGGACVKAGQGHFKKLLEVFPERFAEWEANEQRMRDLLDRPVSILRRQVKGEQQTLTLRQLREEVESDRCENIDVLDFGGCGCAID